MIQASETRVNIADAPAATFERGLDILLAFADEPAMTVPRLAERMGMTRSTTYRFVRGLRKRGLLDGTPEGTYRLGPRILQLARVAREQLTILEMAHPIMRELSERTGETALLTVPIDGHALAIEQVAAPQPIKLTFEVGTARPLHAGASAKVLLAHLHETERERILAAGGFDRRTPNTVTDPEQLRQQLLAIRAQGYAVSREEYEKDVCAIAAPVFGPTGDLIAGLSAVGPDFRMTEEVRRRVIADVLAAAARLTERVRAQS
jgi:DNA-binding IclR family transcriptional regulator